MSNKDDVRMGRYISLILRHKPETIGITLDRHGWANVKELLKGINGSGTYIDMNMLERIVENNDKKRYSFNENKTKIRANQGHSINVDVQLNETEPPEYLYHGTATRFIDSIMKEGLKSNNRLYVHLSYDIDTAKDVGVRHGKPVVIKVRSKEMYNDGSKFYLSENGVWLVDNVPTKYFDCFDYE